MVSARRVLAQPHVHCGTPSPTGHSGVDIRRTLSCLPSRLGSQTPSDVPGPETKRLPQEESSWREPHQGFASITVTARRVGPPASTLLGEGNGQPPYTQCPAEDTLLIDTSAQGRGAGGLLRPLTHRDFFRNGSAVQPRFPEAQPWPCGGRECWVAHGHSSENSLSPDSVPPAKGPLMFSSCVHLRISQPYLNSIYYLDKSLSVPIEPPPVASPQVHRSVLSLHLNCSSHMTTPEGDGGLANGEPMGSTLWPLSTRGKQNLLGFNWRPELKDSYLEGHPAWTRVHLGDSTCPWSNSPTLGQTSLTGLGKNHSTESRAIEDHGPQHHASHPNQLTIHIPGWSYSADTKVLSGSSEKQQREPHMTLSAPPAERRPIKDFLPDGGSLPKGACQSSTYPGPTERQQPSFPGPRAPLAWFLCPLEDEHAPRQDCTCTQIQKEHPKGDATCCDLVVKIKGCKPSEDLRTPQPLATSTEAGSPGAAVPEEPDTLGPSEDHPEPQQIPGGSLTLQMERLSLLSLLPCRTPSICPPGVFGTWILWSQEALEVHRPQFISRSQERLRKLEHMAEQRKAQRVSPAPKQPLQPFRANRRQFTVPHPLSDNLFKPKERCISEKEMYMRSKRIYNNLPEVKKKREEQKKRVILQSNRLRAEVFKKQLLDQLLQRNAV
ncbi:(E2-independent) E3 ubiquitin-conjugating enzyme FATS [Rhynchocyon petersi]